MRASQRSVAKCIAVNAALFGFLFLSVSLNKAYLRPTVVGGTPLATLSGSYSNFVAAWTIGMSPACPALTKRLAPARGAAVVVAAAIGAFAILATEELTSILGVSAVRDWWDVVASALGSSIAILTFLLLRRISRSKDERGAGVNPTGGSS